MDKQITVFSAVVLNDNKVLLVLRKEDELPEAHLKWEYPGGKVDFGETPQEAIVREVLEETGIKVKVNRLLPYVQTNYWKYPWGNQQTLCFVFVCDFIKQESRTPDHHVERIDWIEFEKVNDLPSLPGTMEILSLALKTS